MNDSPDSRKSTVLKLVVGVGASAGGLQPLERMFKVMPQRTGCAFIVVQHLSPDHKSLMDDLLGRQTSIPVVKATNGMLIEPDRIYLPPPGTKVGIRDGAILLEESVKESRGSTRIDLFFQSLGAAYGDRAVAVVLSGSGGDGAVGVQAVHAAGGFVVCQDPQQAQFSSMPETAMQTGCVDAVLPVEKIAEVLRLHMEQPNAVIPPVRDQAQADAEPSEPVRRLFEILRAHLGINFSEYKESTVGRRILRRVALHEASDIQRYVELVEKDAAEADALYHDLLIGVTEFFRDRESFEALAEPLREIMQSKESGEDMRVWVAGCATGQEAYSLAILLEELRNETGFGGKIMLYATDAHRGSLAVASAGIYRREAIGGISERRLEECFVEQSPGEFRIHDRYRRMVVFAPHNLLNDPPFTRLDLISCRNVLIYMKTEAQAQMLRSFNYGLHMGGILFLGSSEGLAQLAEFFDVLNNRAKLFRKTKLVRELPMFRSPGSKSTSALDLLQRSSAGNVLRVDRQLMHAYDMILSRHIPPGILVSQDGEILHYFGSTERYLGPMTGRPTRELFARVSGQLKIALMTLLQRVRAGEQRVEFHGVMLDNKERETINIVAEGIFDAPTDSRMVHLQFLQPQRKMLPADGEAAEGEDFPLAEQSMVRIDELEQELNSTRENLQATIEELQTTNEELQTSNEEMIASNEELQSTNEELQSVNEELYTVNSEYSAKNDQLMSLNAEHHALLESLEIGMVFIDRNMCIRKFNHAIESIIKMMPQDVGRPIDHLASTLLDPSVISEDARKLFAEGKGCQREVRTRDGSYYHQRMYPFSYPDGAVEGAIVAYVDITKAKEAEAHLRESERKLELSLHSAEQVWWDWKIPEQHLVTHGVDYCILGYDCMDIDQDEDFWWSRIPEEEVGEVRRSLQRHMDGLERIWRCEHRYRAKDGNYRWVQESGQVIQWDENRKPVRMIGVTQLIDARKRTQIELERSQRLYRSIVQDQTELISRSDPAMRLTFVNRALAAFYGIEEAKLLGRCWLDWVSGERRDEVASQLQALTPDAPVVELVHSVTSADGAERILEWTNRAIFDADGTLSGYQGVGRDVTELRQSQQRLKELLKESQQARRSAEAASRAKSDFLAVMNHELRTPLNPIIAGSELLKETLENQENRALVEMVHSAGLSLLQLIDSVLDLASLDSKQAIPVIKPFDAVSFFSSVQELFRPGIQQKQLQFSADISAELPKTLVSDANMLRQIIVNLLGNAVKFTHSGSILLEIAFKASVEDGKGQLKVAVRDTGIGIPEDARERIFDAFSQADNSPTRRFGGAGIGLSIARKLTSVLGGELAFESEEGKGSVFVLTLPVSFEGPAADAPNVSLSNDCIDRLRGLSVLVVDDEPTNRRVLGAMLQHHAKHLELASNGVEALTLAANQAFDLVLMDIHMPRMNGFEAAEGLARMCEDNGSQLPSIIYVSADTRDAMKVQSKENHGAAFLVKPLQMSSLCRCLTEVFLTPASGGKS